MALTNEELTQLMDQVNQELDRFGKLTAGTADRLRDAKVGVEGFSNAVREAPKQIGKAAGQMAGAMYRGEQGAKAFNSSIDSMADAASAATTVLSALIPGGPVVKLVVAGLAKLATVAIKSGAELQKAAAAQGDALFGTYRRLAEVGAAGGDGLQGLADDAKIAGQNILDMGHYAATIADGSRDLALYAGTVTEGRKRFAEINAELFKSGEQLERLGLNTDAQVTAAMGYLKLQQRLGLAQTQSTENLGKAAVRYIEEQDRLTKITGLSREQQEKDLEAAMRGQRFAAAIDTLRDQGNEKSVKQMQLFNEMLAKLGPTAQKGFQDMAAGLGLTSEEASKAFTQSGGALMDAVNRIRSGSVKDERELAQLYDVVRRNVASFNKEIGRSSAGLGTYDQAFGSYSDARLAELSGTESLVKVLDDANAALERQKKGEDELLKTEASTAQKQRQAMVNQQELMQKAVLLAAKNVNALATAAEKASEALLKISGSKGTPTSASGGTEIPTVPPATPDTTTMTATGGGYKQPQAAPPTGKFDLTKYLQSTALVESSGNTAALNKKSSAAGMFQFTEGTWNQMTKEMGKQYSLEDRFDPKKSAEVMAYFTKKQKAQLEKGTGQEATNVDLYMAHFLGAGGATQFINAMYKNPGTIAAQLFPEAAKSNPDIFFDKKKSNNPRSLIEVYDLMAGKYGAAEASLGKGKYGNKEISQDVINLKDIPQYQKGGIARGPDTGHLANLHGTEAVIPLPDGKTVPVVVKTDFSDLRSDANSSVDRLIEQMSQTFKSYDLEKLTNKIAETKQPKIDVEELANAINIDKIAEKLTQGIKIPEVKVPEVKIPEIKIPEIKQPIVDIEQLNREITTVISNRQQESQQSPVDMDKLSAEITSAVQNAANSIASNLQFGPILAALEEISRYQKENVSVNERMLRNTIS